MEDTPKAHWVKKKRLQARMDQVRARKRSKILSEPSSSSPAGSSVTIQSPGADSSLSGATVTRVERSELLLMDESFSVRLNAHTDSDVDGASVALPADVGAG